MVEDGIDGCRHVVQDAGNCGQSEVDRLERFIRLRRRLVTGSVDGKQALGVIRCPAHEESHDHGDYIDGEEIMEKTYV